MPDELQACLWVGEDELPPRVARVFDPAAALPPEVAFFVSQREGLPRVLLVVLLAVIAGFALLLLAELPASWGSDNVVERYGNTAFFLALVAMALSLGRRVILVQRRAREARPRR